MNTAVDMVSLSVPVTRFVSQARQALIDGRWQDAQSGETFEVFNPSNESVIARVADTLGPKRKEGPVVQAPGPFFQITRRAYARGARRTRTHHAGALRNAHARRIAAQIGKPVPPYPT